MERPEVVPEHNEISLVASPPGRRDPAAARLLLERERVPQKLQIAHIRGFGESGSSICEAARERSTVLVQGGPGEMGARLVVFRPGEISERKGQGPHALTVLEGGGRIKFRDGDDVPLDPGRVYYTDGQYVIYGNRKEPMALYQIAFGNDGRDVQEQGLIVPSSQGLIVPDAQQIGHFAEVDKNHPEYYPTLTQMVDSDGLGKELTKSGPDGTDLVTFGADGNVYRHTHPGCHILLVKKAAKTVDAAHSAILEYDGVEYPLTAGAVYLVRDNTPHAIYNRSKEALLLLVAGNGHYSLADERRLKLVA